MRKWALPGWFEWGLWLALAALLPFTSLPLAAKLIGSPMVAPPAALALLVILVVQLLPFLLKGGRLPALSRPLLMFLLAAVVSSAGAYFIDIPSFREVPLWRSAAEGVLTLCIGIAFFLGCATLIRTGERLEAIARVINWSAVAILLWSAVQAWAWRQYGHYPEWMWRIQEVVSTSRLYENRPTGLAFEPSWLANQLNLLYLPLWLAFTLRWTSAHRFRIFGAPFEAVLLVGGVLLLFRSLSRVGLLSFMLILALAAVWANLWVIRWLRRKIVPDGRAANPGLRARIVVINVVFFTLLLAAYLGLLFGVGYILSKVDYRMAQIFDFSALLNGSLVKYANQLVFAERLVFWQAGWNVFNDHPMLGVGLGNAGYFFPEKLSAYSWALTEVRMLMYQWGSIPNIKSFWVRLLAETGVVGFSCFMAWCVSMCAAGAALVFRPATQNKHWKLLSALGLAGVFSLTAFIVEGFSVDTFALPYLWVTLGLSAAAFEIDNRARSEKDRDYSV